MQTVCTAHTKSTQCHQEDSFCAHSSCTHYCPACLPIPLSLHKSHLQLHATPFPTASRASAELLAPPSAPPQLPFLPSPPATSAAHTQPCRTPSPGQQQWPQQQAARQQAAERHRQQQPPAVRAVLLPAWRCQGPRAGRLTAAGCRGRERHEPGPEGKRVRVQRTEGPATQIRTSSADVTCQVIAAAMSHNTGSSLTGCKHFSHFFAAAKDRKHQA